MKQAKSARRPRRIWLRVLIGVLIVLAALVLAIVIATNVVLNKINRPDLDTTYYTEDELADLDLQEAIEANESSETEVVYPSLDDSEVEWNSTNQVIQTSQEVINILLIGQDRREGETRARSDTMLLMSFNQTQDTITMVSFLRDLYVQIPGYSNNRLNAAYALGGMELLDETLEQNFGVQIDYNVEVDFSGFSTIIDALGGVDIELTEAEAEYLGLSSGLVHMDGETALSYSRIRYIDSDFGRTGRQRKVMTSLFNAYQNVGLSGIVSIINNVFPLLTTDMSNTKILSMVAELYPMLSTSELVSYYVPAEGTYTFNTIDGMSVIVADFDKNQDLLAEWLAPETDDDTEN